MKTEAAEWSPHGGRAVLSDSCRALRGMTEGQVLRLYHDDLHCTRTGHSPAGYCGTNAELKRLRQRGWEIDAYHEAPHIMVVRCRTKGA